MEDTKIIIDDKETFCGEEMTILEAAEKAGIYIPTLCNRPELSPTGVCRICVVEVEGSQRLVAACHTPIAEGMVVQTRSSKVLASRKTTLELMMAGHTGPCVTDSRAEECELHSIASELEMAPPRFQLREPRLYAVEEVSPYVRRDLSKCVMCRRCVKACDEVASHNIYSIGYRGFDSKIIVDCDEFLNKEVCRDCGICIDYCPTSALGRPAGWDEKIKKKDITHPKGEARHEGHEHIRLLEVLKTEQSESGFISAEFISQIPLKLDMTVSEIYGVATFYSFLSIHPLNRNVIRICKSLPCYMKHAPMIIESVQKTIGIGPGETTADGAFSFELTNCLGACDVAPAMLVNHDVHGNLTPDKIPEVLRSYS